MHNILIWLIKVLWLGYTGKGQNYLISDLSWQSGNDSEVRAQLEDERVDKEVDDGVDEKVDEMSL
jgi:hypothetical protein